MGVRVVVRYRDDIMYNCWSTGSGSGRADLMAINPGGSLLPYDGHSTSMQPSAAGAGNCAWGQAASAAAVLLAAGSQYGLPTLGPQSISPPPEGMHGRTLSIRSSPTEIDHVRLEDALAAPYR